MHDDDTNDDTSPDDDESSLLAKMGAAAFAAVIGVALVDGVTLGMLWLLRAIHGAA